MRGLYKGKYLIAIYDKNDFLVEVGCFPSELRITFKNTRTANSVISKIFKGERGCERVHFIDVTEIHDDIFKEEDTEFLKYVKENCKETNVKKAEEMGISIRTFYRRRELLRVANNERSI